LSGVLGTLWFTTALVKVNFISFSVVFLLQKLTPVFAILGGVLLFKEKITTAYIKWAILAFVAAYFVTFKNGFVSFATGSETITAALYALGAAAAWGFSTAFSKFILQKHSEIVSVGLRYVITTVLALGAVLVMGQSATLTQPTQSQLLSFLIIALSTGMAGLILYYKGLQQTQVKVSTIVELAFPLLAVMIDAFVYKSVLAISQYAAAGVLLFAIYQIALLQRKEAIPSNE
jgi:DME family drug/metabolite transporter